MFGLIAYLPTRAHKNALSSGLGSRGFQAHVWAGCCTVCMWGPFLRASREPSWHTGPTALPRGGGEERNSRQEWGEVALGGGDGNDSGGGLGPGLQGAGEGSPVSLWKAPRLRPHPFLSRALSEGGGDGDSGLLCFVLRETQFGRRLPSRGGI